MRWIYWNCATLVYTAPLSSVPSFLVPALFELAFYKSSHCVVFVHFQVYHTRGGKYTHYLPIGCLLVLIVTWFDVLLTIPYHIYTVYETAETMWTFHSFKTIVYLVCIKYSNKFSGCVASRETTAAYVMVPCRRTQYCMIIKASVIVCWLACISSCYRFVVNPDLVGPVEGKKVSALTLFNPPLP